MTTLLDSEEALAAGLEALAATDPVMARLVADGRPPLRKRAPGLPGLVSIIVSQQLSTASAAAIWSRVEAAFPAMTTASLAESDDALLRTAGLSAPKIRTVRAVADAVGKGALPLDDLHALDADGAHALLTAVHGVGPWTADIYLLFCLGHPDAFPAGDLALQEGARDAYGLSARPDAKALRGLAEAWRPWRGVAAKVLWAHYGRIKSREGAPVA